MFSVIEWICILMVVNMQHYYPDKTASHARKRLHWYITCHYVCDFKNELNIAGITNKVNLKVIIKY